MPCPICKGEHATSACTCQVQPGGYGFIGRPETMMMNIFEREGWYENKVTELEAKLRLYKQALTKSVSLPKGVLPDSEQYYTWMNCGMTHTPSVTQENLPRFKKCYEGAFRRGEEHFWFDGTKVLTKYAKYVIEYLTGTYHD